MASFDYETVGVLNKSKYYEDSPRREFTNITVAETIHYDKKLIEKIRSEGFDTKSLKSFLLGGCYSADSIQAMLDFMQEINPNEKMRLLVTDINKEAFDLIKKKQIVVPKNIYFQMFQGDLTKLALEEGSIDYVRMDFTQNFVPASKQETLLRELGRVLSPTGIISSVADLIPPAKKWQDSLTRQLSKNKGSIVDVAAQGISGYNRLLPTTELFEKAARKSGFQVSYLDFEFPTKGFHEEETKLVVFRKPQKTTNYTALRNK